MLQMLIKSILISRYKARTYMKHTFDPLRITSQSAYCKNIGKVLSPIANRGRDGMWSIQGNREGFFIEKLKEKIVSLE